jgi:8-oxo-dGTP diphosphatase
VPYPQAWALPGGFVDVQQDKNLLACACRKLKEKTGVATPCLEQLGSWGSATRDPRGWSVTQAYFALIAMPAGEAPEKADQPVRQWVPVDAALKRKLAFRRWTKALFGGACWTPGFLAEAENVVGSGGRAAQGYRIIDRSSAATFPRTFKSGE